LRPRARLDLAQFGPIPGPPPPFALLWIKAPWADRRMLHRRVFRRDTDLEAIPMNDVAKVPVSQSVTIAPRPMFGMFGSLQREIDRLFEDFTPAFAAGRGLTDVKAKMDLAETKDGLELTVELPGLEEKDVNVTVSDGVLTVSGEKKFESEKKDKNYHLVERSYGSFSRSISLPDGVKAEQVKATMSKGVLKVAIPTPAKAETKKIEVTAAA
jgi:HSP20 family protein